MSSFKNKVRSFLWRILGIDYNYMLNLVNKVYLKNDPYSEIGDNSYDNNAIVYRWSDAPLTIGKYCSISYDVKFIIDDGSHCFNQVSNYPFKSNKISGKKGISIGNDVWIGMNTIILNGVVIGDGVTIAAGSVVVNDVPDYCVVGGVPAKLIKRKCSENEAILMSKIAWWNWDEDVIEKRINDFHMDILEFISKYK